MGLTSCYHANTDINNKLIVDFSGCLPYVSNGEFLKILVFSDRTEKRNLVLVFQSWKITMDHYSYLITLQAFRKTAHLLIKNSPIIRF